jgi:cytosine/creatinine deaminase
MLVLSRQREQAIMIGDDIEVSIVDIRGDKVRVGIDAPRSVSVHRKEIYEAIRKENKAAAEIRPEDVAGVVASPSNPPLRIAQDDPLRVAIDEAKKSLSHGGIPTGAVLVRAGKIIGRGHNRRVQRGDPMAHAEIDCLTNAGRQKTYRDTILYTTISPCLLCAGAILQFGIPKIVIGDITNFAGGECGSVKSMQLLRECGVEIVEAQDKDCAEMMGKFLQENAALFRENLGQAAS